MATPGLDASVGRGLGNPCLGDAVNALAVQRARPRVPQTAIRAMRCKSRADACLKKTRTISWTKGGLVLEALSDTQYHPQSGAKDEMG